MVIAVMGDSNVSVWIQGYIDSYDLSAAGRNRILIFLTDVGLISGMCQLLKTTIRACLPRGSIRDSMCALVNYAAFGLNSSRLYDEMLIGPADDPTPPQVSDRSDHVPVQEIESSVIQMDSAQHAPRHVAEQPATQWYGMHADHDEVSGRIYSHMEHVSPQSVAQPQTYSSGWTINSSAPFSQENFTPLRQPAYTAPVEYVAPINRHSPSEVHKIVEVKTSKEITTYSATGHETRYTDQHTKTVESNDPDVIDRATAIALMLGCDHSSESSGNHRRLGNTYVSGDVEWAQRQLHTTSESVPVSDNTGGRKRKPRLTFDETVKTNDGKKTSPRALMGGGLDSTKQDFTESRNTTYAFIPQPKNRNKDQSGKPLFLKDVADRDTIAPNNSHVSPTAVPLAKSSQKSNSGAKSKSGDKKKC